eukprot:6330282-Amphidinium_carterae.1
MRILASAELSIVAQRVTRRTGDHPDIVTVALTSASHFCCSSVVFGISDETELSLRKGRLL